MLYGRPGHEYPVFFARFVRRKIHNIYDQRQIHYHTSKVCYTIYPAELKMTVSYTVLKLSERMKYQNFWSSVETKW